MILNILDENRECIEIIRTYESCLWTKKYQDVGGCVLVLAPTDYLVDLFRNQAVYISRDDDSMMCEIKKISLAMDNSTFTYKMTITALACENILNQRIVWNTISMTSTAEMYVRRMVLDNVVNPLIATRKIPFIKLGKTKGFTESITKQVSYDELLPVITEIAKTYDFGFKLVRDEDNNLLFECYRGLDRTDSQDINDYVIFSKDFNNLLAFDWEQDKSAYKNVALVGGEGEGSARKIAVVGSSFYKNRYETFTDAKSLSSNNGVNTTYTDELTEAGKNDLATKTTTQAFSCKIDVEQYEYKVDYDLGDKVMVVGDYNLRFNAKIVEVIECNDNNGYRVTITLEI